MSRKIYDCFTFFNEIEILRLRLCILYPVVDYFVICESTTTFQGRSKESMFLKNIHEFAPYLDKIRHIEYTPGSTLDSHTPWAREHSQRSALVKGFCDADESDLVLISDVDEIPRPSAVLEAFSTTQYYVGFFMIETYYMLNYCRVRPIKIHTVGFRGKDVDPSVIRRDRNLMIGSVKSGHYLCNNYKLIPHAGWHFSCIGNDFALRKKISAYSHTSMRADDHYLIEDSIAKGETHFPGLTPVAPIIYNNDYFPSLSYVNNSLSHFIFVPTDTSAQTVFCPLALADQRKPRHLALENFEAGNHPLSAIVDIEVNGLNELALQSLNEFSQEDRLSIKQEIYLCNLEASHPNFRPRALARLACILSNTSLPIGALSLYLNLHYDTRNYSKVFAYCAECILPKITNKAFAYFELAKFALKAQDLTAAISLAKKSLQNEHESSSKVYFFLGNLVHKQGMLSEALYCWSQAVICDPIFERPRDLLIENMPKATCDNTGSSLFDIELYEPSHRVSRILNNSLIMNHSNPDATAKCNICGASSFGCGPRGRLSKTGLNPVCLSCRSLERHRSLFNAFKGLSQEFYLDKSSALQFSRDISVPAELFLDVEISVYQGSNSLDIMNIDRESESYDVVICNHVLEHVSDDLLALSEMVRIIRPSGFVFFSVPDPLSNSKTNDWGFSDINRHGHYRIYGLDICGKIESGLSGVAFLCIRIHDPVTNVNDCAFLICKSLDVYAKLKTVFDDGIIQSFDSL